MEFAVFVFYFSGTNIENRYNLDNKSNCSNIKFEQLLLSKILFGLKERQLKVF